MVKAIALTSGGLDSTLAIRHMMGLGYDVYSVHMVMPFGFSDKESGIARKMCDQIGAFLHEESRGDAFFKMVRKPKFGYGKNMNPCIDCRIAMLERAKEIMLEQKAEFIITGEVVGQRPMSQRKDAMNLIEKQAGVKGLVLRPLCAKNLKPTIVEEKGIVDRKQLLDFSGRSRTPQINLAKKYGIIDYPSPAGGCSLTEPGFSARLKHLFEIKEKTTADDWNLLMVGRHISIGPLSKVVMARNERENQWLKVFAAGGDCILDTVNFPGPMAIIVGPHDRLDHEKVAAIMLRYGKKPKQEAARVSFQCENQAGELEIAEPASDDWIQPNLIV